MKSWILHLALCIHNIGRNPHVTQHSFSIWLYWSICIVYQRNKLDQAFESLTLLIPHASLHFWIQIFKGTCWHAFLRDRNRSSWISFTAKWSNLTWYSPLGSKLLWSGKPFWVMWPSPHQCTIHLKPVTTCYRWTTIRFHLGSLPM
jgi:hypothetical protein